MLAALQEQVVPTLSYFDELETLFKKVNVTGSAGIGVFHQKECDGKGPLQIPFADSAAEEMWCDFYVNELTARTPGLNLRVLHTPSLRTIR